MKDIFLFYLLSCEWRVRRTSPSGMGLELLFHPRCERVTSRAAGYDCVINATVREGQGMTAETTPPLCVAQKP